MVLLAAFVAWPTLTNETPFQNFVATIQQPYLVQGQSAESLALAYLTKSAL